MVFKKNVRLRTWRIWQKNSKCVCYPKDTFQRENSRKLAWKSLYRRRCSTSCAVANQLCDKLFWNGMLSYWLDGEVFFFFAEPALDLMPSLQGWGMRDCNKGIKFKKGAINSCCILRRELQGITRGHFDFNWKIKSSMSSRFSSPYRVGLNCSFTRRIK